MNGANKSAGFLINGAGTVLARGQTSIESWATKRVMRYNDTMWINNISELAGIIGSAFTAPSIPGWYAGLLNLMLN